MILATCAVKHRDRLDVSNCAVTKGLVLRGSEAKETKESVLCWEHSPVTHK